MATKKITFMERWAREHVASGSNGGLVRAQRMRLRSQVGVGFHMVGKELRKLQKRGGGSRVGEDGEIEALRTSRWIQTEEWARPD